MMKLAIAASPECWRGGLLSRVSFQPDIQRYGIGRSPLLFSDRGLRHLGEGSETLEN